MTPRNPKRNKPPGAAFSDVEVREALRSILARQDMMEARQVEMMNQLEVLGRQASVQQQALMDTLEAAKSALVAVERYDRTPSFVISASIHVWNAMPVRSWESCDITPYMESLGPQLGIKWPCSRSLQHQLRQRLP